MTAAALPPVVDAGTWQHQLDALRAREKAATRPPGPWRPKNLLL